MSKKILYIDMDNTLVDFESGIARLDDMERRWFEGNLDHVPGIFSRMDPMPDAIAAFELLSTEFDTYILSTAPWFNPSAWQDKIKWVHKHFGTQDNDPAYKRLILSHHKNLNRGDFLVDDRPNNGAKDFEGDWIHFGSATFPDWEATVAYLLNRV
jgi:5'(3')-deoxyribonucleotidase